MVLLSLCYLIKKNFIGRAGFAYVSELDAVEIGYVIDYKHWGKGYATEAVKISICCNNIIFNIKT
ncbi:GNAT family N-acetyltransferase [Francisella sp. SYW-9]|uniref:GNAT family N-acetyltransferase n=1 Tax=Francisella sp. SYW-9 TaxID=2610888 RepID=UPI001CD19154